MYLVYVMLLELVVLIVPTASRMATIPMASTPHSQRQLWPLGVPAWGLPSPSCGALGLFGDFSGRCGLTASMLGATPAQG